MTTSFDSELRDLVKAVFALEAAWQQDNQQRTQETALAQAEALGKVTAAVFLTCVHGDADLLAYYKQLDAAKQAAVEEALQCE